MPLQDFPPTQLSSGTPSSFTPGGVIFAAASGAPTVNGSSFIWDNANQFLQLSNGTSNQGAARWHTKGDPFVIHVSTTTFNSQDDYFWTIGYNVLEGTNTTRIDTSEPYWKIGLEHHYYDGSTHACEFNCDFLDATGSIQRRPFNVNVNRSTGDIQTLFRTKFFYLEDNTGGIAMTLDNSGTPGSVFNFGQNQPGNTVNSQCLLRVYGDSGTNHAPINSWFRSGLAECLTFVDSSGNFCFANTGGVANYNDSTLNSATNWKITTGGSLQAGTNSTLFVAGNGTSSNPSITFAGSFAVGFWYSSNVAGWGSVSGGLTNLYVANGGSVIFLTGTVDGGSGESTITRDGSNILAQKNGNVAQTHRTYAGNGANFGIVTVNESLTIAASATTDSATVIPAGAVILAVAVRVTTVIPTAVTFTVTAATGGNTFDTAAVSTAANSTDAGTAAGALYTAAGTKVRITPNTTPGAATGVVRLAIMYYLSTAPTS